MGQCLKAKWVRKHQICLDCQQNPERNKNSERRETSVSPLIILTGGPTCLGITLLPWEPSLKLFYMQLERYALMWTISDIKYLEKWIPYMKRETREHLDDAFNFLAGRWLVGHKLTCFASSSNSVGRAMVTLFYSWLFPSCCKRTQGI